MVSKASTGNKFLAIIQWMWKSELENWIPYSDVKNTIIEEARSSGKNHAIFDDYYIDFIRNLQISNKISDSQRLVKRVVCNTNDIRLREERFMNNPFASKCFSNSLYSWISFVTPTIQADLKLKEQDLYSCDETAVPTIVEKAGIGIMEEGKLIGEKCEGEWMAKQLIDRKNDGMKEVWKCCASLYSKGSFLYTKMNEVLRSVGSDEYEESCRIKLRVFAPFCLLLWKNPFNDKSNEKVETVYRGIILSLAEIDSFKHECFRNSKSERSFQPFTSCTRNRALAEISGGNALLIIYVSYAFTMDLAPYSQYPHEEEVLIMPGSCFIIVRVDYDKVKEKHLIYLNPSQANYSKS